MWRRTSPTEASDYVDDVINGGRGDAYNAAIARVRKRLNVDKGQEGDFEVLGRQVVQADGCSIKVHQKNYVEKIKPIHVGKARRSTPTEPFTAEEKGAYRGLNGELSWPARQSLPGLAVHASILQQRTEQGTVADLLKGNLALRKAKDMVREGVCLNFPARPESDGWAVGVLPDASCANLDKERSQGGYNILVSSPKLFEEEDYVNVVAWQSTKLKRVLRSTLATEAATASIADRGQYIRTLLSELLYDASRQG